MKRKRDSLLEQAITDVVIKETDKTTLPIRAPVEETFWSNNFVMASPYPIPIVSFTSPLPLLQTSQNLYLQRTNSPGIQQFWAPKQPLPIINSFPINNNVPAQSLYKSNEEHLKSDKILSTFKSRIKLLSVTQLNSSKYYQGHVFDKDFKVEDLKEAIQTIDDLISLLKMGHMRYRQALFNYLVSTFPLPKNNGNLAKHPCDDQFLKKLINNTIDLNKVLDVIGSTVSVDCQKISLKRLLSNSTYIKKMVNAERCNDDNALFNSEIKFQENYSSQASKDAKLNNYNPSHLINTSLPQYVFPLPEIKNNNIPTFEYGMRLTKRPRNNFASQQSIPGNHWHNSNSFFPQAINFQTEFKEVNFLDKNRGAPSLEIDSGPVTRTFNMQFIDSELSPVKIKDKQEDADFSSTPFQLEYSFASEHMILEPEALEFTFAEVKKEPNENDEESTYQPISKLDIESFREVAKILRGSSHFKFNCTYLAEAFLKYLQTGKKPEQPAPENEPSLNFFSMNTISEIMYTNIKTEEDNAPNLTKSSCIRVNSNAVINRDTTLGSWVPAGVIMREKDNVIQVDSSPIIDVDHFVQPSANYTELNNCLMKAASQTPHNYLFGICNLTRCGSYWAQAAHTIVFYATAQKVVYIDCQKSSNPIIENLSEHYNFLGAEKTKKPTANTFSNIVFYAPVLSKISTPQKDLMDISLPSCPSALDLTDKNEILEIKASKAKPTFSTLRFFQPEETAVSKKKSDEQQTIHPGNTIK